MSARARAPLALAALGLALAACRGAPPAAPPRDEPGMVPLPGGRFWVAALAGPHEDQGSLARVHPFLLDVTEVTVAAYGACVKAGRCTPAGEAAAWPRIGDADRERWSPRCNRDREDRADHPVNCVDAAQAEAYCAFAGKRLPAEVELEWAARNGKAGTRHPWGKASPGDQLCWNGEGNGAGKGAREGTCPVGSHPAGDSAAGVKDLEGGVWEWTSTPAVLAPGSDGRGGTPARAARGGGWADVDAHRVSIATRLKVVPGTRAPDLGFRCAKSL